MIKVSVILPTYNSGGRLQQTLDSIFLQNGNGNEYSIELLVVDDCSTDDTCAILAQNGIQFRSTETNSGGPNKGRNIGLDHATGDVICFIDHDDIWHPDKLLRQLACITKHSIVSTAYTIADSSGRQTVLRSAGIHNSTDFVRNETFLRLLSKSHRGQVACPSTLMIRNALKDVRFEEAFGMVDYDWKLRLFEHQSSAEIGIPLMTRFVNGNNLSLDNGYRKKDYYYSLMCLEDYEARYPREVAAGRKRIEGSRARYFYLTGSMPSARRHFKKSPFDLKTILYYCTTFYGNHFIKKHFRVFG